MIEERKRSESNNYSRSSQQKQSAEAVSRSSQQKQSAEAVSRSSQQKQSAEGPHVINYSCTNQQQQIQHTNHITAH
jgi:hypothetical protein